MNRDTIWGKAGRKAKREEFEDMTIEMQDALNRELEDAKEISDPGRRREAMETVQGHMLAALIDCQRKTSERVKQLVAEKEKDKSFWSGAKWVAGLVQLFVTSGGLIIAIKFCKVVGILS